MTAGQDGQTWDGKSLAELARENERLRGLLGGPEAWALEADVLERQQRQWADAEARRRNAAQGRQPIVLVPAAEVRKRVPPPYLAEGLIPAAGIGVFFGESGTYKSFLVLNLLLCAGSEHGAFFLGHMVTGGGLGVYVMGEGQYDAGLRLEAALGAHLGYTDERLAYVEQAFPLSDEAAVDEVIERCRELSAKTGVPVRLVVFDSFADFYGAEDSENSNTDMQRLIASMKRISAALGCVVMANAHTGHGGTDEEGSPLPPPARLRGASRFRQAFDFELMATGSALIPTKNRYGPKAPAMRYAMAEAGGSLVLAEGAAQAAAEAGPEPWPHPCPFGAWVKVADAIGATPGMSMNTIQKVARVNREHVSLALLKGEEAGFFTNAGTKGSPKWKRGSGLADWCEKWSTAGSARRLREHDRQNVVDASSAGDADVGEQGHHLQA
jgi:hypothetical protein